VRGSRDALGADHTPGPLGAHIRVPRLGRRDNDGDRQRRASQRARPSSSCRRRRGPVGRPIVDECDRADGTEPALEIAGSSTVEQPLCGLGYLCISQDLHASRCALDAGGGARSGVVHGAVRADIEMSEIRPNHSSWVGSLPVVPYNVRHQGGRMPSHIVIDSAHHSAVLLNERGSRDHQDRPGTLCPCSESNASHRPFWPAVPNAILCESPADASPLRGVFRATTTPLSAIQYVRTVRPTTGRRWLKLARFASVACRRRGTAPRR
jgi:hypothetical protein